MRKIVLKSGEIVRSSVSYHYYWVKKVSGNLIHLVPLDGESRKEIRRVNIGFIPTDRRRYPVEVTQLESIG